MLVNLKRIFGAGWQNFSRNVWLSVATVLIMVLVLSVITSLVLINVITQSVIATLQDKVDVSVYFRTEVPEGEILKARQELLELNEVKSVEYVTREEALRRFKQKHQENEVLLESLKELDDNPLQASLNIKAQIASQYEAIVNFLERGASGNLIDKINYRQNQEMIEKFLSITRSIQRIGFGATVVLIFIAVLVAFNTIRLTMYSRRDEIEVMRLVGASNWHIRGPFLVEGMIYGLVGTVATLLILYPIVYFTSPRVTNFIPGSDILYFFESNFFSLFFLLVGIGIVLGGVSSLMAMRRYLKV